MHNKKHPMDELFRKALDGHQMIPSERARQNFLEEARNLPAGNRNGRKWFWIYSILSFAVITSIAVYLKWRQQDMPTQPLFKKSHVAEIPVKDLPSAALSDTNENGFGKHKAGKKEPTISIINHQTSFHKQSIVVQEEPPVTDMGLTDPLTLIEPIERQSELMVNNTEKENLSTEKENIYHDTSDLAGKLIAADPANTVVLSTDSLVRLTEKIPVTDLPDQSTHKSPDKNPKKIQDDTRQGKVHFSAGIHYSPEWMFNTIEGSKFVNNAGLEVTMGSGRFSVRTGLGISISKGTNELTVAYNDYLGSYNHLDSMEFTWSDPVQNYLPTFYMTRTDVWDSLLKLDYPKVVKQYYYLQVPLVLGYDAVQTDRFSFGFRMGPILSVLLSSKQQSEDYDPGLKRIISINNIPPEQVNLNWQAMFGINTSIRTGRRSRIELEPYIKYYFNSVYEKPSGSMKPWSAGLRAAFCFGF